MKATKSYVAYYRVSTNKQGQSKLGLESQRQIVANFINGNSKIIDEYVEVESGKKNERPELQKAVEFTKQNKATLVIAKLDRLSRNAGFIFTLRDSGVDFVACDIPDANTLTVGIFATIAQHEREIISERTRAALKVKKKQGFKLGNPENLTDKSRKLSIAARKKKAKEIGKHAYNIAIDLRQQGLTYSQIAQKLNEYDIKSRRGGKFYGSSVRNLIKLFES